ncbi:TPA: WbuC family cupin fold metalloprotein, partial [Escherichia coli]
MKIIDDAVVDELVNNARVSERKRTHYLLHTSHQDKVQRLIITMVKGSYVEP